MADTQLAVGVKKQDSGDTDWHSALDSGFDDLNTRLTLTNAGDPNGVVTSKWIGQTCFDTTNDIVWVAKTADVNNDWVKIDALIKDTLTLANALIVQGAATMQSTLAVTGISTLTGLLNANGGVHIPTTKTIEGTSGEDWLADDAEAIDPMSHVSRHEAGGADELAFPIGQVLQSSHGATARLTSTYQTMQTQAWTPSAGSGTARCLVLAQLGSKSSDYLTTTSDLYIRVQVNGTTYGGDVRARVNAGAENKVSQINHFAYATGIATGGAVNVILQAKTDPQSGTMDMGLGRILVIDLGQD